MKSPPAAEPMASGLGSSELETEAARAPEGAVAAVPNRGADEPLSYSQTMDYNTAKGLQRIYFGFDDYTLRPDARQRLSENAEHIHNADSRFRVEGHADERGSAQYNLALGELRAKSAYQYLVDLGIDSEKMEYRTMGEEQPLNPGHNEKAWAENRRAEFYALNGSEHVASQAGAQARAMLPDQPAQLPTYHGFDQVFDEVWVIQSDIKDSRPDSLDSRDFYASPDLRAKAPGSSQEVSLPLKHTSVNASISGYVGRVDVSQKYQNPYSSSIEAVYIFPLPQNAAVSDFIMTIGNRRIRGIIREREEAERLYKNARDQGFVASLFTQERANIVSQKAANIEPGKEIDIDITYFNTLKYSEGEYEFVFPMVVGPRNVPDKMGSGISGAAGRSNEVQYLKPDVRSGRDISLTVNIDAGVSIEKIYSNTHAIEKESLSPSKARVAIRASDSLPNKDFVLRYRVAGNKVKTALMTERDETGGYFTLIIQPPANLKDLPRTPKEMVFVLDCSGSMNGRPMDKAKKAMRRALKNLNSDDAFQIIRFSSNSSSLGSAPIAATPENIEKGLSYLDTLRGSGGAQMIEGVKAALDFPHDENRYRIVSFITDGYIGNEAQILGEVHKRLGASRIFSFGVGSSVNRYLIERMAKVGKGAVAYITTNDSDIDSVDLFYDRIGHPGLADIKIDWGEMEVSDVYPKNIPDLFVGRPIIITGRFKGRGEAEIKVKGRVAGESQTLSASVNLDGLEGKQAGISKIWARAKIADLMDSMAATSAKVQEEVRQTALTHGLVSAYTAFVAVDSTRRTEGDHGTTIAVPVPAPEGVRYETTVVE